MRTPFTRRVTPRRRAPRANRWDAWVSRLTRRFGRWNSADRLALPLHAGVARAVVQVLARWTAAPWNVLNRLDLTLGGDSVALTQLHQTFARAIPQVTAIAQTVVHHHAHAAAAERVGEAPRRQEQAPAPVAREMVRRVPDAGRTPRPMAQALARLTMEHHAVLHVQRRRRQEFEIAAERLVHRSERWEVRSGERAEMRLAARTAAPRAAAESSFTTEWRTPSSAPASRHAAFTQPAPAPPAVNIEQLADQVMRQLDRRVIAHRERMGRI